MAVPTLRIRGETRPVTSTLVMAVVNASVNSFSDGGRYVTLDDRLALAAEHIAAGADIIDVGGQSAITDLPEVDAVEERDRVVPIVEWIARHHPDVLISVDTYKPLVAEAVLAAGASIINDVSGLLFPPIASLCAEAGAALVIMHTRAGPKQALQDPDYYDDVVSDVVDLLEERIALAVSLGVEREAIVVDPGPDFTKTPHQTIELLRGLTRIRALDRPVLLALSRKDFLGAITLKSPAGRGAATLAAVAHYAVTPGNIVRVHDVAGSVDVVKTIDVLTGRVDIPRRFSLPDDIRHEPIRPGPSL